MDMDIKKDVAVVDSGSGYMKAGLASATSPSVTAPQVLARPKYRRTYSTEPEIFVGQQARSMSGVCMLSFPSQRGLIESYADQSLIFQEVLYKEIGLERGETPVLLAKSSSQSRHQSEKIISLLFEELDVPALAKKSEAALSLFDSGRTSGLVLDIGDTITNASAVFDGYVMLNGTFNLRLGGRDVTEFLARLLMREKGFYANTMSGMEHVRQIKECLATWKQQFPKKTKKFRKKGVYEYSLPDGRKIEVSNEGLDNLSTCSDVLFNPEMVGCRSPGISEMTIKCVENVPTFMRSFLLNQILLSGGSTMLPGLREHLAQDVYGHYGKKTTVIKVPRPQFSVWRGGATLSHLSTFPLLCATKDDYFEEGAARIDRKFY